jgi:hypothetical protein
MPVAECDPFITLTEAGLFVLTVGRFDNVHVGVLGTVQGGFDLLLNVSPNLGWVFVAWSSQRLEVDIGDEIDIKCSDFTTSVTHCSWRWFML